MKNSLSSNSPLGPTITTLLFVKSLTLTVDNIDSPLTSIFLLKLASSSTTKLLSLVKPLTSRF